MFYLGTTTKNYDTHAQSTGWAIHSYNLAMYEARIICMWMGQKLTQGSTKSVPKPKHDI